MSAATVFIFFVLYVVPVATVHIYTRCFGLQVGWVEVIVQVPAVLTTDVSEIKPHKKADAQSSPVLDYSYNSTTGSAEYTFHDDEVVVSVFKITTSPLSHIQSFSTSISVQSVRVRVVPSYEPSDQCHFDFYKR